ncbi:MAG: hypothetical protein EPO07_10575 [Verrucomicrobia bacterium]|nr:MAG: hypothetical protein EPO07_10575 [Verrucomicrobiota bacterium]
MKPQEYFTLVIAVVGAVLGLLNTWRGFERDRVKLKVIPKSAICSYGPAGMVTRLCIEVINMSYIPVTVSQIGYCLSDPPKHFLAFIPEFFHGEKMPVRLEPREAVTAYVPVGLENDPQFANVTKAFAKTACGRTFESLTPSLKSYIASVRKAHRKV